MNIEKIPSLIKAPLRDVAGACGIPVGAAVDMKALQGEPEYANTLKREMNIVVAENVFKQFAVWTGPATYDFTDTDRLAEFARDNGMTLRGHTLIWHQAVPKWLREGDYSADDVRGMLKYYILAFVGRYRGVITVWDVVNEAIADPEGEATPGHREDSFYFQTLGPDYIALAFQWAHEADPDARLYYNDYSAEDMGSKSNAVYDLVRRLQSEGTPIHGVGLQCHLENGWRVSDVNRANIRRIVDLGLEWQATEVDIRMHLDGNPASAADLALQADGYRDLANLCTDEPGCRGLIFWGLTDRYSWIPNFRKGWGAALPLDADYRPKPAYDAVYSALQNRVSRG